jgi:hypothetical protein
MTFPTVTAKEMRAGQMLTWSVLAAFIGARFLPSHARQIRVAALGIYLAGIAAFIIWFLVR